MNELVQILKNTRQHLMTGVSHMIPFVVSGGYFAGGFRHVVWQRRSAG
ncbi:putative PTS system fructose-like transporter subunit EIIC, partial [Escherichia coli O103:H25 str. CVM9340]